MQFPFGSLVYFRPDIFEYIEKTKDNFGIGVDRLKEMIKANGRGPFKTVPPKCAYRMDLNPFSFDKFLRSRYCNNDYTSVNFPHDWFVPCNTTEEEE